jgi:hypothetical protein
MHYEDRIGRGACKMCSTVHGVEELTYYILSEIRHREHGTCVRNNTNSTTKKQLKRVSDCYIKRKVIPSPLRAPEFYLI